MCPARQFGHILLHWVLLAALHQHLSVVRDTRHSDVPLAVFLTAQQQLVAV